jgi:hypothetical protein
MTKRSPGAIEIIRALAPTVPAARIAREIGVSPQCVANWASQEGIGLLSLTQAMKAVYADPAFKATNSQRMKALNADPAFKAKMKALHADPAFKATNSQRMKALHADPAFKAKMKALHADPAFKATNSQRMKALHADPAFKAKMKALHADPAFKAKMKALRHGAKGVEIPKWVPTDLHDEFLDIAAKEGEERAASHVRRLKKEMMSEMHP